jgi:hypothetical protein
VAHGDDDRNDEHDDGRDGFVTAGILIPVRAFVLSAVLFRAPGAGKKFLRIWPFLLALDEFWSLSPFLLLHHINFGLALRARRCLSIHRLRSGRWC